jgi:hypothetical protein
LWLARLVSAVLATLPAVLLCQFSIIITGYRRGNRLVLIERFFFLLCQPGQYV